MNGTRRFAVRVLPRSRATKVGGRYGDSDPPILIVRVTAPAVDGRANAATIAALADALGRPQGDLRIVNGLRARTKLVEARGVQPQALAALLAE